VTTLETKPTSKERALSTPRAGRPRPGRPHVIWAVFKRNFLSYFSNPAGYVFITLFVFISSCVAFWQDVFFTNNLANLDQLNRYMPYLLLFFIPAITMSSWADERRQGTDELLLTLPAHDLDVVLGKYLAALGIYTVALTFCLSHVFILRLLGEPDYGVLFATYLGYWLMGVLLIAVGMVASLLSSNVTVAFILGAVFCAVPIFLGLMGSPTAEFILRGTGLRFLATTFLGASGPQAQDEVGRLLERWSVPAQFQDFGTGVVTIPGVLYFGGLAAAMLYLNMTLLGRRHWAGGEASSHRWLHSVVRFAALILGLFSFDVIVDHMNVPLVGALRADVSAEKLHTLSSESLNLVDQIPADRPVLIQAYYSPEVPREFVETKADMLGLLREYASRSGGKIQLNLVPTDLYSNEARGAEKQFGIQPRRVFTADQGKQMSTEIFLGVAFTSGLEEVVIPFFDRGLPVEYELTRSIRVVSRSGRKKVGILNTDAKMMGGFDTRSFSQTPEWSIVTELKKQFDVTTVSPDAAISADVNVLLVAQPSSLAQRQIDNLTDYVKKGGATLLFLDPFPYENPSIAPEVPKMPPGGPFGGGQPPEPKGNLRPLLDLVGLDWPSAEIVWNAYNPHPQLELPREIVFIGKGSGEADAFNPDQIASAGLQEIVTIFPGLLRSKASGGSAPEFTPLLRTSRSGGVLLWNDIAQQSFMGFGGLNPRRRYIPSAESYALAARISGQVPAEAEPAKDKDAAKKGAEAKKAEKPATRINVIAIADLDMIGEQFFQMRRNKIENLDFDNVPFVLNCVDVLAGDESFVSLRKKRLKHRTLIELEKQANVFKTQLLDETRRAEDEAKNELDEAQRAFSKQVDQVQSRTDLDERTKEIQLANLQDFAQRRLDVKKAVIEDVKEAKIRESKAESERKTRQIQNTVRFEAAALPPLPPLILGLIVWIVRLRRENLGATPTRLA
jgi:gliding motility-associated transport system permease protein/gliding motility-associatede transport system auxiliary component